MLPLPRFPLWKNQDLVCNHKVRHNKGIRNEVKRTLPLNFQKTCSSPIAQRVFACRQKRASCAKMGRNHSRQVFLAVLRSPVAHLCAKGADISCEHIKKEVHSASIFHLVAARGCRGVMRRTGQGTHTQKKGCRRLKGTKGNIVRRYVWATI